MRPFTCALLLCLFLPGAFADEIHVLPLQTRDIVYDPARRKIYASVPGTVPERGNSIATIDPRTGEVGPFLFVGSEPRRLALSDDSRFLYVGLDGIGAVRRLDLTGATPPLQFSMGAHPILGLYRAGDMAVLPGRPESLAVSLGYVGGTGVPEVVIYDNGSRRPKGVGYPDQSEVLVAGDRPDRLYGTGGSHFFRMAVDPSGVQVVESRYGLVWGGDLRYDAGRIYDGSGRVVDPEAMRLLAAFPLPPRTFEALVAPDARAGRVFYLAGQGQKRPLLGFDTRTYARVGAREIQGIEGPASRLLRWGADGLAFRTDGGQIFLIRTTMLARERPAADLAVAMIAGPQPVVVGESLAYTLVVTNRGPDAAAEVTLDQTLPDGTALTGFTASQGSGARNGDRLRFSLGSLAPGASATATVRVAVTAAGSPASTAQVSASGPDPEPGNNTATASVTARGADAGRLPVRLLRLPTNDLVYSSLTRRIYATVPGTADAIGNRIAIIDPETFSVAFTGVLGNEPTTLALSADGGTLYVGFDGMPAVQRLDLGGGVPPLLFPLKEDSFTAAPAAVEMLVPPGSPEAVIVGAKDLSSIDPTIQGVSIYDDGVPRPRDFRFARQITPSASPTRLYGLEGTSFLRIALGPEGLTRVDATDGLLGSFVNPLSFPVELAFAGGRIYSNAGIILDPEARRRIASLPLPNSPEGAPVVVDVAVGRLFHLTGAGERRAVLAYDTGALTPAGAIEVRGVDGRASDLIRWGEQGLAFRTNAGQIFLIRAALAPTFGPGADLTLEAEVPAAGTAGQPISVTLTVTNRGPEAAAEVTLTDELTPGAYISSAVASQGSVTLAGRTVTAHLGRIAPGGRATLEFRLTPGDAGIVAHLARAIAGEYDPNPADNTTVRVTTVQPAAGVDPAGIRRLALPTAALVYDPFRRRIWASVPGSVPGFGNSVVSFDPETGAVGVPIPVGNEPKVLALSDDGVYLYVALDGEGAVRRVHLPSGIADLRFSLGSDRYGTPYTVVDDMEVLPGEPRAVAVARAIRNSSHRGKNAIFDDGVMRPRAWDGSTGAQADQIEFDPVPGDDGAPRLYGFNSGDTGFDFFRLAIGPDGLHTIDRTGQLITGFKTEIEFDGGLLFTTRGGVIDPRSLTSVGTFTGIPEGALVEPDTRRGEVYFLVGTGGVRWLRSFDARTFAPLRQAMIVGISGETSDLIRWGEGGLAFRTGGHQVFLFPASLTEPLPPATDLSVTLKATPDPVTVGQPLTTIMTVTNRGPGRATDVRLRTEVPAGTVFVSMTSSQGTVETVGARLTAVLGDLAPGGAAAVTLVLRPETGGTLIQTAQVSGRERDPRPENNSGLVRVPVQVTAGPDLTGRAGSVSQRCRGTGARRRCTLSGVVRIRNTGTASSPPSTLRLFLSEDLSESDTLLKEISIGGIRKGRERRVSFSLPLPEGTDTRGKWLIVVLDPLNAVAETDEANNVVVLGRVR